MLLLKSLNPCFSGIYCDSFTGHTVTNNLCLNPCFSGIYCDKENRRNRQSASVLIIVLVEYTVTKLKKIWKDEKCLNPCFSGIYCDKHSK